MADAFIKMRLPFDSSQANILNREIFETIYVGAMTASMELAQEYGPYSTYKGSPISKGLFHFELWVTPTRLNGRWNWNSLRQQVLKYGVRNSLLIAPMPTASTSQIFGNNECLSCNFYFETCN